MGLIGNSAATNYSYDDRTSYGWSISHQLWDAGVDKRFAGGWTGFTVGECLHFLFDKTKLTMFSATKAKRFVLDNIPVFGEKVHSFQFPSPGNEANVGVAERGRPCQAGGGCLVFPFVCYSAQPRLHSKAYPAAERTHRSSNTNGKKDDKNISTIDHRNSMYRRGKHVVRIENI
jgi:hypothetical protein